MFRDRTQNCRLIVHASVPVPGTWAGLDPPREPASVGEEPNLVFPLKAAPSQIGIPPTLLRPSYVSRSRILGKLGSRNERKCFSLLLDVVTMATVFFQSDTGESGKVGR